ncbi:MAG: alginate lyase family protein [Acidobacteriota bacterium]|nr:alginate lyase family protein [Acidobacteriota bacterium]
MHLTRRTFCSQAAPWFLTSPLFAQSRATSRPDVAAIDHDRILKAATSALARTPAPPASIPAPRSPGTPHDLYSEAEDYWPDPANPAGSYVLHSSGPPNPAAFTAHRDALLAVGIDVPALTAAFVLTREARYADHAMAHLRAWFIDPDTSMSPNLAYAYTIPPAKTGRFEGIVEAVHLAELVQCIPFLTSANALSSDDHAALTNWLDEYFAWLMNSRTGGLARDSKSHHGTSWLLQAAAIARLGQAADDRRLTALRHQYQGSTLRAQMVADGTFPHELTTSNPYRNSLFNLDMLAGICLLLTTRFDDVWNYELQDGPGMRSAIARHYPYILDRGAWPYRADAVYFNDLPVRPPSLLFAARAYERPEYASLWKTLPADPKTNQLERTYPIRQPLLWVTRPSA